MPETKEQEARETKEQQAGENEQLEHAAPGMYAPFDYSEKENLDLAPEESQKLTTLLEKKHKKDMASRRWEVEQSWEARMFDRGYQYLLPRRNGGWQFPDQTSGYAGINANMQGTNIYTPYGTIVTAALGRSIPKTKFLPKYPDNDKSITAAEAAEDYRTGFALVNDLISMHADLNRYLWTDGRAVLYTRHVKDAQRFGYEEDSENAVVPETEEQPGQSATEPNAQNSAPEPGQAPVPAKSKRTPRGEEVVDCFGKLEHKVPMAARDLGDCDFLILAREYPVCVAKAWFPEIEKKIQPTPGPGENELDRIARINCSLALAGSYVTGDTYVDECTVTYIWLRPAGYNDLQDDDLRKRLFEEAPEGLLIAHAGKEFAWARPECMDDHLELVYATRGDSQNRAALGSWMIPIQKRLNNWIDLLNDYFIRTVPKKYMDSEAFDVEALRQQTQVPGDVTPFVRQPGLTPADLIWVEPTPTHQSDMPLFIDKFANEYGQLLSGGYPALSGGDTKANDTATGIGIQRDQALGRLSTPWHNIQNATARYYLQAVQCAARCREERTINMANPAGERISVELEDLKGDVLCYPEADSSFPESWNERQARFTALVNESQKNPFLQMLLALPKNQKVAKDSTGLSDFEIPQAAAYDKQLGELEILKRTGPMPNPQVQQLQQMLAQAAQDPETQSDPQKQEMLAQGMEAMKKLPPEVSTVPVDKDWDDHEAEAATIAEFVNGPEGRKMAHGSEQEKAALKNIKLHGMEHKALVAPKDGQQKPPTKSINIKDLPPEGQVQLAKQAGITIAPPQPQIPGMATEQVQ